MGGMRLRILRVAFAFVGIMLVFMMRLGRRVKGVCSSSSRWASIRRRCVVALPSQDVPASTQTAMSCSRSHRDLASDLFLQRQSNLLALGCGTRSMHLDENKRMDLRRMLAHQDCPVRLCQVLLGIRGPVLLAVCSNERMCRDQWARLSVSRPCT